MLLGSESTQTSYSEYTTMAESLHNDDYDVISIGVGSASDSYELEVTYLWVALY